MTRQSKQPDSIFDECLVMIQQDGETIGSILQRLPEHADSLRPELEAAAWLAARREALGPRPGFVKASKSRLIAETIRQKTRDGSWWRGVVIGKHLGMNKKLVLYLELVLLLLATMFYSGRNLVRASNTWMPGDFLYPTKTFAEEITLWLTLDPKEDACLHIEFTQQRLMEVQALFFENRYEEVPSTVHNFGYHVSGAILAVNQVAERDPTSAKELAMNLEEVLSGQTHLVLLMAGFSPGSTRAEFERAVQISEEGLKAVQHVLAPGSGKVEILGMIYTGLSGKK